MDLIGDSLTRIRNGLMAKQNEIEVLYSKEILGILRILKDEGYISNYTEKELRKGVKRIQIELKYLENSGVIKEIKRVSKPSRRVYNMIKEVPSVYNGLGISILSTSKGILSDSEARSQNVGGELICYVF
jgi:small subunit ribosomal protein S8